ncbi:MAG: hypothetical protein IT337_13480 [Thermomicrobiales bacterium]|nr:hypothetical protein [Thermomicrobiales bacterium]
MHRLLALFVSLGLGVAACAGIASAQDADSGAGADTVNSDGGYIITSDGDANPNRSSEGVNVIYGDVSTGNKGGEVLGDPNAVYQPDLSGIPHPGGSWTPTITGIPVGNPTAGNMLGGMSGMLALIAPTPTPAPEPIASAEGAADETTAAAPDGEQAAADGAVSDAPVEEGGASDAGN